MSGFLRIAIEHAARTEDESRLRAAEQLVAAHRDDGIPPARMRVARRRFAGQSVIVEREHKPLPRSCKSGMPRSARERAQLDDRRLGDESGEREIAAMDFDDDAGLGAERAAVVVERACDSSFRPRRDARHSSA